MRIEHLELQNFKRFERLSIDLHPHFTLLVGENGCGKTTILDALAVAMGVWLVNPPDDKLRSSRRKILSAEVRLEPRREGDRVQFREMNPTGVTATGQLGLEQGIEWTIKKSQSSGATVNDGAVQALNIIRDIYLADQQGGRPLCPVLAYYGAGRAWLPSNDRPLAKIDSNGLAHRWAAFYDCFNERIRFRELHRWFSRETIERGNRGGRWRPGFDAVRRAIVRSVPEADDVWFDSDRDQIVLSISGRSQPFDNLSAGQRMMLALVADIAIKAVTQNAFLIPPDDLGPDDESVPRVLKETPGVVLIDELDVHLHPIWQRRVATDLKNIFPLIQFVCTTHSPQVIGEVLPDEIRLLRDNQVSAPVLSYGMDSNWVVEELMGGSRCNSDVKDRLKEILGMIDTRRLKEAEAAVALLRGEIGNSNELQRAMSLIERIKLLGK